VAVGLVDDGGHPHEPRREPADETRLRRVRVDDVRPLGGDDAAKPEERAEVTERRHGAAERRDVDEPHAASPRGLERRGVGLTERDCQRHLVARALERHDRRQRVLRRAAEREARDHVQDAQAHW